jgi:surface antigen
MNRSVTLLLLVAAITCSGISRGDDSAPQPAQTKRQMMKECMAKQKASDGGMPKEEMKRNCRDVTATERENAKTAKDSAAEAPPSGTTPHE